MSNYGRPAIGRECPWGTVDDVKTFSNGVLLVETAGHGGYWLPPERMAEMPEVLRDGEHRWNGSGSPWFEEDSEWVLVDVAFPAVSRLPREKVLEIARTSYPAAMEQFLKEHP